MQRVTQLGSELHRADSKSPPLGTQLTVPSFLSKLVTHRLPTLIKSSDPERAVVSFVLASVCVCVLEMEPKPWAC